MRLWRTAGTESARCFNPRTPCGVRRLSVNLNVVCIMFQSTHSLRSATRKEDAFLWTRTVSIHALLAECDRRGKSALEQAASFNPRTPCGVRRGPTCLARLFLRFQSTHSLRSATALEDLDMINVWVSIHALLAECDTDGGRVKVYLKGFNPRTPCGVRLV